MIGDFKGGEVISLALYASARGGTRLEGNMPESLVTLLLS
jgi:hypothetical protein